MKKITIINLYGKHNIGDMAIRNSALKIIEEALGLNKLYLLCESNINFPFQTHIKSSMDITFAPYGYAINTKGKPLSLLLKFFRFIKIISASVYFTALSLLNNKLLPKVGFYRYIKLIKDADLIIAMGGGYFITSHSVKDYFGICLNTMPIYIAKIFKKKNYYITILIWTICKQIARINCRICS